MFPHPLPNALQVFVTSCKKLFMSNQIKKGKQNTMTGSPVLSDPVPQLINEAIIISSPRQIVMLN
jgi:hypothetical protein